MFRLNLGLGDGAQGMMRTFRRATTLAVGAIAVLWGTPAFACPASNAIVNFDADPFVGASFTIDGTGTIATYTLDTTDENSSGGIPGLIEYCVYPSQPPGNPSSAAATYGQWTAKFHTAQGYFDFERPLGDPTNIPFDGTTGIQVGTATWPVGTAPVQQTILLHVNDPTLCGSLYTGSDGTCFVFPGLTHGGPNPQVCNSAPACKDVVIDEAITSTPLTVPGNTPLHIHYTYTIINQPTNTFNMLFLSPTSSTSDINTGGGKDYFGCEQQPDPAGQPGKWGTYSNYAPPFTLNFVAGNGNGCPQSRFFLQLPVSKKVGDAFFILAPGQSVTFKVDMDTRTNKGGKQEFTSCGLHLLNSGFTVKWFEGTVQKPGTLFSYSTNVTPIYVNVVGLPGCPAPSS